MAIKWTAEEMAELAAFDAQVDAEFEMTEEEALAIDKRDADAKKSLSKEEKARLCSRTHYHKDVEASRRYAKDYYYANRDRIRAQRAAWWQKNKDRENAKARKRYHDKKRAALDAANIKNGKGCNESTPILI